MTVATLRLSRHAVTCLARLNVNAVDHVEALRSGEVTPEAFLADLLKGARTPSQVEGATDYATEVARVAALPVLS